MSVGRGYRPATSVSARKPESLPFHVVSMARQNIGSMFFCFVTKHACDGRKDGRTDTQNYDPQDRASIAALRCKNTMGIIKTLMT